MGTEQQQAGGAGRSQIQWRDDFGAVWLVTIGWHVVNGRIDCAALTMDSDGKGVLTSSLVRQVERQVRAERTKHAASLRKIARLGAGLDSGRRAARQVKAMEAQRTGRARGRPRDDAALLKQAKAVRAAYDANKPLIAALEALDPGWTPSTYVTRLRRVRAWDREQGPGLLAGTERRFKTTDQRRQSRRAK